VANSNCPSAAAVSSTVAEGLEPIVAATNRGHFNFHHQGVADGKKPLSQIVN